MENELENSNVKLSSEPGENKFLFFFEPKNVENECIGGISLVNGIYVFAGLSLILAINFCIEIFDRLYFIEKLGYILISLAFVIIAICAFFAAFSENMTLAKISYWMAGILFCLAAIKFICKSILKMIEFINPFDGDFLRLDFIAYIFGRGALLFIFLYFIWIIFCFMSNHEKNN